MLAITAKPRWKKYVSADVYSSECLPQSKSVADTSNFKNANFEVKVIAVELVQQFEISYSWLGAFFDIRMMCGSSAAFFSLHFT